MSGWNLPPGCRDSDLPGNGPEGAAWDEFVDSDAFPDTDDEDEIEEAFQRWRRGVLPMTNLDLYDGRKLT